MASAAGILVSTNADDPNDGECSISEAIASANTDTAVGGCAAGSGADTITFTVTALNYSIPSALTITDELRIEGRIGAAGRIILTSAGTNRIFFVEGTTLTLVYLELRDGSAESGGLIYVDAGGTLITDDLLATGGTATGDDADMGGGAIAVDGGTATIVNSTFSGNRAAGTSGSGGAILNNGGTLTITGSTFTSNSSNRAGGAIEDANGTTSLTNVTLTSNNAGTNPGNGGGLHTGGGNVTISGGAVTNNVAVEGGGLWSSGTMEVTGPAQISSNTATGDADGQFEGGGGVFNQGGTLSMTDVTLGGNTATGPGGSGGALFLNGSGTTALTGLTISSNTSARAGGGVEVNGGEATLTNVTFGANDAGTMPGNGGALHVTTGTVTIIDGDALANTAIEGGAFWNNANSSMTIVRTRIAGNFANGEDATNGGGGVFNNGGTLEITNAELIDNSADMGSGSGGGLFSTGGTVMVNASTFDENSANRAGGGIEVIEGELNLNGVTFTANVTGSSPGNGGALHVSGSATITARGGTVSGNTAANEGGGFWNHESALMDIEGFTFDGNTAAGDDASSGGGGLYNNGTLTIASSSIIRNRATGVSGSGGGILSDGGVLVIRSAVVDTNSANRAGGGIEGAGAEITLDDVQVRRNSIAVANPGNGGGLHSGGGSVNSTGSSFNQNTAVEGGGLWVSGTLVMAPGESSNGGAFGNVATGDAATNGGGGIYAAKGASLSIFNAIISDNRATGTSGSGGGVFLADGVQARFDGTLIQSNSANRAGGGIEVADDPMTDEVALLDFRATARFNRIDDDGANPGNGGAIHSGGGAIVLGLSDIHGNGAVEGGGIWSNGVVTMADDIVIPANQIGRRSVMIYSNIATGDAATTGGGGLFAQTGADFQLEDVSISDNRASGESGSGGGLFVADGASVSLANSELSRNQANRAGAGIEVADDSDTDAETSVTITTTTVARNRIAVASPGNGGGLHVGGAGFAVVDQSTFSGNVASEGAGVWIGTSGTLVMDRSTVSGNLATGNGGGVYEDGVPFGTEASSILLTGVTIANNAAGSDGGGIYASGPSDPNSFELSNTILWDNSAAGRGDDCAGTPVTAVGPIIVGRVSCVLASSDPSFLVLADPMLDDLMDNGGPTLTHALRSGSPAIDAGDSDLGEDQRGYAFVGPSDIGAFEFGAASPVCAPDSPIAFGDFNAGDDQFLTLRATDAANLSGCTLVVYDNSTQTVRYATPTEGELASGGVLRFEETITADGTRLLPSGILSGARGALLLFSGDLTERDAIRDADLARVVAARVYEGDMVTLDISGGTTEQQRRDLRAALTAVFTSVEIETGAVELALTAHPNPARSGAQIGFGVASTDRVVVTIYDMLGRQVATLTDRVYSPGRYTTDLDANRLSAGLYVIRIETGDRTETTRLTVVR